MTIKIKGLILFLFGIALFNACEYEPTGVFEPSVNQNTTPPQIQIIELNLDEDTVHLYADYPIRFNFKSSDQEITHVRFILDNRELISSNSNTGSLSIEKTNLQTGVHNLSIEVYTATGTGSIAELNGAEAYVFTKSWKLMVYDMNSHNITAATSGGFLKLGWPKYLGSDFKEYVVQRRFTIGDRDIKRLTSLEFTDSSYVGEGGGYLIYVKTKEDILINWGYIEFQPELPNVYFEATETNDYILKFNKSKFYKAIHKIELYQSVGFGSEFENVNSIQNPSDTLFNLENLLFGDYVSLKIRIVPNGINPQYTYTNYLFESQIDLYVGFLFKETNNQIMSNFHAVNNDEFIYAQYNTGITRYSVSEKNITDRISYSSNGNSCDYYNLETSPSGNLLTAKLSCNDSNLFTNLHNSSEAVYKNISSHIMPISDVGIGIINNIEGGFSLFNFNSNEIIASYNKEYYGGFGLKISSNADFLFIKDDSLRLMQYSNLGFKTIWGELRDFEMRYCEFNPLDPTQVVYWDGYVFTVKHCHNFSNVYEFPLTDERIFNVDYYHNEFLTYKQGNLLIRKLTDGSVKNVIPVSAFALDHNFTFYLINHTILCSEGVIYFVN